MTDYYLEDKTRLQGQPKRTIADYVESNGILVPNRFESLDDAINSGITFLMRSEHQQEYDGVSGLLDSPDFKDFRLGQFDEHTEQNIDDYCELFEIPKEEFLSQISYSFWEKLDGFNRSMVADSAIKGRYHIFTTKGTYHNYTIWDNGKIDLNAQLKLEPELVAQIPEVIEFYETIRNLPNFDPNHCPIIELQTVNGRNYFLQYHRTRDFVESKFVLDRDLENGEIEVQYSRGATNPNGEIFDFQVHHMGKSNVKKNNSSWTHNGMVGEYMALNYKLIMSGYRRERLAFHTVDHLAKSSIFKPQLFISDNNFDTATSEEIRNSLKLSRENPSLIVPINVISDGRKAYIKRI